MTESNAVLPLATRMETELPWGHTRGFLSSPLLLKRNHTSPAEAQKKNHEIPPSSQYDALLFLQGLESNPESSLKTPQEA